MDLPGILYYVSMLKSIALFDIDNTMYEGFSYSELLEKQVAEGLISAAVLGEAESSLQKYQSKVQDYETTVLELLDVYAKGLQGERYDEVLASAKQFYGESKKFFPYVRPTIAELRRLHDIALVTGEPQFVAEAVAEVFGLGSYYSTEYEVQAGTFTRNVTSYLASRHEKHDAIQHLMLGHGAQNSFAFGDSEGDIEMLRAVEHPICLNCTDGLRAIAQKERWHMPSMQKVTQLVQALNAG